MKAREQDVVVFDSTRRLTRDFAPTSELFCALLLIIIFISHQSYMHVIAFPINLRGVCYS